MNCISKGTNSGLDIYANSIFIRTAVWQHVKQFFDWYTNFKEVENYTKVASLKDIAENDYNLNIPLYVEKVIEDNLPSVEVALADLKTAWNDSLKAEEKFKSILLNYI